MPLQAFMKLAGVALRWTRTREYPLHRQAARFHRQITTRLFPSGDHVAEESSGPTALEVELLDLGQGGALVRPVKGKLHTGTECRLEVPMGDSKTVTLNGTILRNAGNHTYALVFSDLDEKTQADLLWHLFVEPLHNDRLAMKIQANPSWSRSSRTGLSPKSNPGSNPDLAGGGPGLKMTP